MEKWQRLYMILTFALIISVSSALIMTPDQDFSPEENRYLASFPKLSWSAIKTGEFGEQLEKYIADQFPLREYWVSVKAWAESLMNKKENNDVYAGKEGYLLQKIKDPTIPSDEQLGYVKQFADRLDASVYFLLAPNSAAIHAQKMPSFAPVPPQQAVTQEACAFLQTALTCVDVYEALAQHADEYIYYRTDHHWTTLGAYYAYREFAGAAGLEYVEREQFKIEQVSDSFYGSLYAQSNFRHVKPDTIEVWLPQKDLSHTVTIVDDGKVSDSLYAWEYLDQRDQYPLFLGGNHALVTIETKEAPDRTLLVIKDSYAHALIPFLTAHYRHIHIADLRYLNMSMAEYARLNEADEVLLLYNVSSFQDEGNIVKLRW